MASSTLRTLITRATGRLRRVQVGPFLAEAVPVGPPGQPFLRRLALGVGRARVMVHLHEGEDPRGLYHSHPLAMLSILVQGGYREDRTTAAAPNHGELRVLRAWSRRCANWIPSSAYHHVQPLPGGALTLVFGWFRKDGRWGFYDPLAQREIPGDSEEGKGLIYVKPEEVQRG